MTVTETPPEVAETSPAPPRADTAPVGGLPSLIGTGDHKALGRLYIGFALLFGLVAGVAAELYAVDRIDAELGDTLLSTDSWYQVFTFSYIAGVFLFLVPLLLGVAYVVVPLQVGATSIAFPRAAAASFWAWLVSAAVLVGAYAVNGGPAGGSEEGVSLWIAAYGAVVVALLLGAVSVAATVLTHRVPGLWLDRVPFFSWSMFVAASVWILSFPVLVATLVVMWVDHRYGQVFVGAEGEGMYDTVAWVFQQPQVYAFAIPVLGFIGDVVPTAARARQSLRTLCQGAVAMFGILSFGAFVQPALVPESVTQPVYDAMAVLAILPVLALVGGWISTLKDGRPRLSSPLIFAVASLLMLLAGVLAGAFVPVGRFDLDGTLFQVAQIHYVLLAAAITGIGGLWYWATKIVGNPLPEGIGRLAATILLVGTIVFCLPDALSGAFGDEAEAVSGVEGLNAVSAAGLGLLVLGLLVSVAGILMGMGRSDEESPADPWGGQTLEWATASPPVADNFTDVPPVESAEPLLDLAESQEADA